jgi:hypothetical protein
MRHRLIGVSVLLTAAALAAALGNGPVEEPSYMADFGLERGPALLPKGGNPYLTLRPGAFLKLEGEDDGEAVVVEYTVLPETRTIRFQSNGRRLAVRSRLVEEREWVDGELAQVSILYHARCPQTGNIYWFGEDATQYEDGAVIGHEGSWLAGREGAMPGLAMPAYFIIGSRYHQALAPDVAMERAEHVSMGLTIETPAGIFENCVAVLETTPLEPDEEVLKIYAPHVGLIMDGGLQLVEYHE